MANRHDSFQSSPWIAACLTLGILGLYAWFLAEPIHLTTADLGRHLKNGELVWRHPELLVTNFYSYTEPGHPFINHHWGSGVVFFLAWKLLGFQGAQFLFIALNLLALAVMFRCAQARIGVGGAALLSILIIPLLAIRAEVRPEAFSYFFTALFFQRLARFRDQRLSLHDLWWLPVLEAVWVNLHSYFVVGPALIAAFLLETLLSSERRPQARVLAILLGFTLAATLLNPFGVKGALVPLTMFREYGYRLVENQSVPFLLSRFAMPSLWLFIGVFVVLAATLLMAWFRARRVLPFSEVLIAIGVSAIAWGAYRNLTLFGLLAIPLIATGVEALWAARPPRNERWMTLAAALMWCVVVFGPSSVWSPPSERGIGLEAGDHAAADFVKREHLQGPTFNNYDIGGYLIFHLFPAHRVFVDNRPEAYSASFFTDVYVPMQENEAVWRKVDAQYGFNLIAFHRHDLTPWGQPFLIRRVDDPAWAPVFVDQDTIIFLKRNERNQSVINRFEVPRSAFQVVKPPL